MQHAQGSKQPRDSKASGLAASQDIGGMSAQSRSRQWTEAQGETSPLSRTAAAMFPSASTANVAQSPTTHVGTSGPARVLRHRTIESMQPWVEFHRSTSGRNLRLRHVTQPDLDGVSSPLTLTPRAPPGKRPSGGPRRWKSTGECESPHAENNAKHEERSADDSDNNNNDHSSYQRRKDSQQESKPRRRTSTQERRSSFSISPNALLELERMRCLEATQGIRRGTKIDEDREYDFFQGDDDEDNGADEGSDDIQLDEPPKQLGAGYAAQSCPSTFEDKFSPVMPGFRREQFDEEQQQQEYEQQQQDDDKPLFQFALWSKASRKARLPSAILTPGSGYLAPSGAPAIDRPSATIADRRMSRDTQSMQVACEMVSQLHVEHGTFATAELPKTLSLTRSVSPRIGASTTSTVSCSTSSEPHSLHSNKPAASSERLDKANPITKWKRGELIGEGTFGKVRDLGKVVSVRHG